MRASDENTNDPSGTPSPDCLLRAIVESSDDAIISKDLNGIVISWNQSAERIFGFSAGEMLGQTMTVLVPPDRLQEDDNLLQKVRMGDRIDRFETMRKRKNGEMIDVAVSVAPVYSPSGRIVGASKVVRDISEAKRATPPDLLLAAIVNSSDDAIISKNLDGTITSWNSGAQRLFGYAPEEIIGQSVFKLIPPDRRDEEPKIIERLRRGERVDHFETLRLRKNGEQFPISLTISPVRNAKGVIVGASKIARDISELKAIAKEREVLLQSERTARMQAELANRMKDDFLSTISHELRTPLNAILGWTEILASSKGDRGDFTLGIDVIRRNARMQARLVEDLLDLGRISSGKMKLNVEPANLREIVIEAIASVQHAADSKRIAIKSHLDDFRGVLMGDTKRLQQVVWNLLANAIKFTGKGGLVSVHLAQVGSDLTLTITDNGCGISANFLPFLFERFRQADASTTRQQRGLGIGLALVKDLVDLHGGKVRCESKGEGQGAMFVVTLPISVVVLAEVESRNPPVAAAAGSVADLTGIRVLALDDDTDSVDVVKRILSTRGAEVRIAFSVSEAMTILRTFTPDVILSDIGMPGQDGYDFIRQLREHSFFAGIPAVALTALARSEDRTRALDAGFQSHIAKPLSAVEVVSVVRSLGRLRGSRDRVVGLSR
jgi:PAS domain S-box-containing protein